MNRVLEMPAAADVRDLRLMKNKYKAAIYPHEGDAEEAE